MFNPGDFVVCVSSPLAGKEYIGTEGTVVADAGDSVSVSPTLESRSRAGYPGSTGYWTFYKNVYKLELVEAGNVCEDWS